MNLAISAPNWKIEQRDGAAHSHYAARLGADLGDHLLGGFRLDQHGRVRQKRAQPLADGARIVLREIGDRLVVGDEPAKEPHQLDIAAGLALEPSARLHRQVNARQRMFWVSAS